MDGVLFSGKKKDYNLSSQAVKLLMPAGFQKAYDLLVLANVS